MENIQHTGTLYIVATPIGNLADISQRALTILTEVSIIAAEDTRHSRILLNHYGIKNSLVSLHDHNESEKLGTIIEKLKQGNNVALISDAGTPLINDPGYHLVKACHQHSIKVVPIPGACAVITALCVAGVATDRFCFEGFLPAKNKAKQDKLTSLLNEPRTIVLYESTHRVEDTLTQMENIFGPERYVVLARELTKTWETIYGAKISELKQWVSLDPNRMKGEIVLVIEGATKIADNDLPLEAIRALNILVKELPLKKASAIVAELYHCKKNALYDYAINNQ